MTATTYTRLRGLDVEERLMRARQTDPVSGCWRFPRSHKPNGYAVISVNKGIRHYVHRIAYELWVGPIPDGYTVDHVRSRGCIYKDCFRPDHLETVTLGENIRRAAEVRAPSRSCRKGHPLAAVGKRCSVCRQTAWTRYNHKKRGTPKGARS